GHILTCVVTRPFNHRRRAAIPHTESLARATRREERATRRAVQDCITDDDILSSVELCLIGWANDNHAAAHPFADGIIRLAGQRQPHPRDRKGAETLPGTAVKV